MTLISDIRSQLIWSENNNITVVYPNSQQQLLPNAIFGQWRLRRKIAGQYIYEMWKGATVYYNALTQTKFQNFVAGISKKRGIVIPGLNIILSAAISRFTSIHASLNPLS